MDNTSTMIRLLSRLKTEMNGEVVDYMQVHGLNYPLSYGVSSATVRTIAKEYAPNHNLAEFLYKQQVRELQLAAATIADPQKVNEADLDFWIQGITTMEMAENVASFLLSRTDVADIVSHRWIEHENENVRYCALITAVKALSTGKIKDGTVEHIVLRLKEATDTPTLRALCSLIERYILTNESKTQRIRSQIKTEDTDSYRYVLQELSL